MNKNKMAPPIRFQGFIAPWKQRKLSEVTDRYDNLRVPVTANLRIPGNTPYYGANGIQDYVDGYTHDGEFILVAEDGAKDLSNYPINYVNGRIWVNNHAHVLQGKNHIASNKFLAYAMRKIDIKSVLVGGGRAKLNAEAMMKLGLQLPSYSEQAKIGASLQTIDNLITLHQRKLEQQKKLKAFFLKNMFPEEGETVPRIRFKGFTGDWEQRKLEICFSLLQNNTLSRDELGYENGLAMNVHYGDVLIKFDECLDVSKESLPFIKNQLVADKFRNSYLKNGDVVVADTAEDETVGKCTEIMGVTNQKVISGLHTIPFRPNDKFATGYLGFYLNSAAYHNQLIPLIQGTKVSSISKSAMQKTVIKYPASLEEQELIG